MLPGLYSLVLLIVMNDWEFGLQKQEVIARQFHVPSPPGVLKKVNINGNILRDISLVKNPRVTNKCDQRVLENFFYFIMS